MTNASTPKLVICGSSAGHASAHRASSSYLLDVGDEGVLIDCGDGATRNFLHAGYKTDWVQHIFISHTDPDHWCGLPYFIVQRHLSATADNLTVHCPAEAINTFQAMLIMGNLFPEKLRFTISFEALTDGEGVTIGNETMTPIGTTHLARARALAVEHGHPNRGECFAMRWAIGDHVLLYSADLGGLSDLDRVETPIDTLLIETSHVDLDALWPWAAEREIKRIILTHIADTFDQSIVNAAPKYTDAEIILAEDGMTLPLA
jgi:ribonuclease BN (tRNA processing enzyme)